VRRIAPKASLNSSSPTPAMSGGGGAGGGEGEEREGRRSWHAGREGFCFEQSFYNWPIAESEGREVSKGKERGGGEGQLFLIRPLFFVFPLGNLSTLKNDLREKGRRKGKRREGKRGSTLG